MRKACTSGLFHRKELTRLVAALLGTNQDGLRAYEIAIAIARDKGCSTDEKPFQVGLTDKVSRALSKLKTQGRAAYLWQLASPHQSSIQP